MSVFSIAYKEPYRN